MTRIGERLADLQTTGERALVCYTVAGDPSPAGTLQVVAGLQRAGVDVVELGVPFSDPLADGPSIQAAAHRALEGRVNVAAVLDIVRAIRERSAIPIVLMTYYNPVLRYGVGRFARDAAAAGVDGTIQVDLPPDEAGEWVEASRSSGLDTVFLVAPTSTDARIERAARASTGFVYCVSRTGVTGARQDVPADLPDLVRRVRAHSESPVCVGFGVSQPEHVVRIGQFADGVVVGSKLVETVGQVGAGPGLADAVYRLVAPLKEATRFPAAASRGE